MLVAISQRNDKNKYGADMDSLENNYAEYFEKFGIALLCVPNILQDVAAYLSDFSVAGVILSGGNDINHAFYEETPKESLSYSEKRDRTERAMLEMAIRRKLPVFGICRGAQFINAFFGGKISVVEKHSGENHAIELAGVPAVQQIRESTDVNSYHKYGITKNTLAKPLREFALSPDGIVEGFYHESLPIAAIQWHPERASPDENLNKTIMTLFTKRKLFWETR